MKLTALSIDGFGVWNGLRLDGLSGRATIYLGPNEAGKTTLLEFLRSVLYGFSTERRGRYLPPVRGGRGGGQLEATGPGGEYCIRRYAEDGADAVEGALEVVAPDGSLHGLPLLKSLRCDIDEPTFNHVFAVGIREIQELGALDDTRAGDLLFKLAAGMDRVSLVEVTRELTASRERLLSTTAKPSRITELWERREKMRSEIGLLRASLGRFGEITARREHLDVRIAGLESQSQELAEAARLLEVCLSVREAWQSRSKLEAELAAVSQTKAVAPDAVRRMQRIGAKIARRRRQFAEVRADVSQVRRESDALAVNMGVERQAARIEALCEQQAWAASVAPLVGELTTRTAETAQQLVAELEPFGLSPGDWEAAGSGWSDPKWDALREMAASVRDLRRRVQETQAEHDESHRNAEKTAGEVTSRLAGRGAKSLAPALEQAGELAAQLRRRVQLDERLAMLNQHRQELAQQCQGLMDHQVLPVWMLAGLGGLFVAGVMLILVGLFLKVWIGGTMGWALAFLGVGGTLTAAGTKLLVERSAERRLKACQAQLDRLGQQLRQATDERDELDKNLPRGSGPLLMRLQAAESDLESLEELAAIDSQRKCVEEVLSSSETRLDDARRELQKAQHRWKRLLAECGIPEALSPRQVRQLVARREVIAELTQRLARTRQEFAQRNEELSRFELRMSQVAAEAGLALRDGNVVEKLGGLRQDLEQHQAAVARQAELYGRGRVLRRRQAWLKRSIRRWRRRRVRLLRKLGVADSHELRERFARRTRIDALAKELRELSAGIAAALSGRWPEEMIGEQLRSSDAVQMEAQWEDRAARQQAIEQELKQLYQERGQAQQELSSLAQDRRLANRTLDLGVIDSQIREAIQRWQVLAATQKILEHVREDYERRRQPLCLQAASRWLERMTYGQYRRVWAPLSEEVLYVDDASGKPLPVDVLSRGTREQLFLCLRLALVEAFARQGSRLPFVLDDVLVNFDSRRAAAAAEVLRDFSSEGHQILMFTCHEHIGALFQSLHVPVRRLPDRTGREDRSPPAIPARQTPVPASAGPMPRRPAGGARSIRPAPVEQPLVVVEEESRANSEPRHSSPGPVERNGHSHGERRRGERRRRKRRRLVQIPSHDLPFPGAVWQEPVLDDADVASASASETGAPSIEMDMKPVLDPGIPVNAPPHGGQGQNRASKKRRSNDGNEAA